MTTPVYDFVRKYADSQTARLHMPGHKGVPRLGPEPLDLTEIQGADELYFADGIIAESEQNATEIFGTGCTLYSTEGSSHGIRSMLILARQLYAPDQEHPCILAARNAHKAFLYGAAICDMDLEWLYPSEKAQNSAAACGVTPEGLQEKLLQLQRENRVPFAFYVTSPDYLGQQADIGAISAVCRSFHLPLLVDNAHGAYLHFLENPQHPMDLGADMCCDSAHKTLPVLTGGAYVHLRAGLSSPEDAKAVMAMTGSSSPSYLIMASLDLCNRVLAEEYREKLGETVRRLNAWKQKLEADGISILKSEPLKAVIDAAQMGFTGTELGEVLREHHAEPEFCDADYLVLMITPDTSESDLQRAGEALREARNQGRSPRSAHCLRLRPLEQVMRVREAVFAPNHFIPVEEAVGRICGAPAVSCPPAIPLAVSGERITEETVRMMQEYGIEKVSVIRE